MKNKIADINKDEPLVCIVVLAYNGEKWINGCLATVLKTSYQNFKLVLVDNASTDNTIQNARKSAADIDIISNRKNYGFAKGCNIGIRYALEQKAEYVVLLNQDTKVHPDWISELVTVSNKSKSIGILSPFQYDYEGAYLDRNFKGLLSEHHIDEASANDFSETKRVIGAAMMISLEMIRNIGAFDPLYFCYCEETDFCRRAIQNGYTIGIVKKSKIYHWHTLAQGDRENMSSFAKRYLKRNWMIYSLKDPARSLIRNLYRHYEWNIREIYSSHEKKLNKIRRILVFIIDTFYSVLPYIPAIIFRRYLERYQKKNLYVIW